MTFAHEDPEFDALIRIVSDATNGINPALIEKDYWVTHTLWALQNQGFDIRFKGGTSLSKGFHIIRRFSEDLDVKISPGTTKLPEVESWKSDAARHRKTRGEYFAALATLLDVPGTTTELQDDAEASWTTGNIHVKYPGYFFRDLPDPMRPFVLLEIGSARVEPSVKRTLSSFVHDWLESESQIVDFIDNRPKVIHCVHPLVTLFEKLEAIVKGYNRGREAPAFVRHYEDSAAVIDFLNSGEDPELQVDTRELYRDMKEKRHLVVDIWETDDAFRLAMRRDEVQNAYDALESMYWGNRIPIDAACEALRGWIRTSLPA